MKTLISFLAKQNNQISINNFKDFALSQALMNKVRGGDGEGDGEEVVNPSFEGGIPWLPEGN